MGFDFRWVSAGNGRLALWHRPKLRAIPYLGNAGCDRVVTLLSESEQAGEIGEAVGAAGIAWTWIPLASGRPPEGRASRAAREGVRAIVGSLERGESVLLHCSAGIHRTGMVAYAVLRSTGLDEAHARELIREMRIHTLDGLRPDHFDWWDGPGAGP